MGRVPGGHCLGGLLRAGPVDFQEETIAELIAIGEGVPAAIELGYHLCYGSPADEHVIQPKDAGIMVEIANAVSAGCGGRLSSSTCRYLNRAPTMPISHPSSN